MFIAALVFNCSAIPRALSSFHFKGEDAWLKENAWQSVCIHCFVTGQQ
ncbi:MAG: hypothetical protein K6C30_07000 [Bacteroidaceae bacterium]|nr:hypothetical protein [Bacteroidaceae bacterium]